MNFKKLLFWGGIFASSLSFSQLKVENINDHKRSLGIHNYLNKIDHSKLKNLQIAILDNGFGELSRYQPKDLIQTFGHQVELIEFYPKDFILRSGINPDYQGNPLDTTAHGQYMALVFSQMLNEFEYRPKIWLLNANGFTNLQRAVAFVLENKIDVVLYSQNWEFGGLFDGSGFINQMVSDSVDKGVLWINAAGNYHQRVLTQKISQNLESKLFRIKSYFDETDITITLSWSDFTNDLNYQAKKDLDFEVLDANDKIVSVASLAQINRGEGFEKTQHAREKIDLRLSKGIYKIRIKNISKNFQAGKDFFRLTVDGQSGRFEFLDASGVEEIMIPADNPKVLTVGDISPASSLGPTLDGRNKPDVKLNDSMIKFSNGLVTSGTSFAAALYSSLAVLKLANNEDILATGCVYLRSVLELPNNLTSEIAKRSNLTLNDFRLVQLQSGRFRLLMKRSPHLIQTYFSQAYSDIEKNKLNPKSFQYYLKVDQNKVQSQYFKKGIPVILDNSWIEIKEHILGEDTICR